jgi:Pentapeptide repeats (9 copies)
MTDAAKPQEDAPEMPELKPANENPWYVLATLHGEQLDGAGWYNHDSELHARNRLDWNKWAAEALSENQRNALLARKGKDGSAIYSTDELTPHYGDAKREFVEKWCAECLKRGCSSGSPYPARPTINFEHATFSDDVSIKNASFIGTADFIYAIFIRRIRFDSTTFSGYTSFFGAKFSDSDYICFEDDKFTNAKFTNVTFANVAYFESATFSGDDVAPWA